MRRALRLHLLVSLLAIALVAAACSGDDTDDAASDDRTTEVNTSAVAGGRSEPADAAADSSSTTEDETPTADATGTASPDGETADAATTEPDDAVVLTQADGGDMHIITISAPLLDPFFSAWEKGTLAAGLDLGVRSDYTAPADFSNLENDFIRLMEAAISQNPDGIVMANFFPDVQEPGLQDAVSAGIPVVVIAEPTPGAQGAVAFIGQNEHQAGLRAGERMIANGVTSGLCMDHVPQNPSTTRRCEGFVEAFDSAGLRSTIFNLPLTDAGDPQAIAAALRGQLSANPDIDGVFTLGSGVAESAIQAIADLGAKDTVALGTSDLSTNVLNAVAEGDLLFASDQQPYLMGYYGVLIATQFAQYGLAPTEPIRTGPSFVTADNVDIVIRAQEEAGVRGAG